MSSISGNIRMKRRYYENQQLHKRTLFICILVVFCVLKLLLFLIDSFSEDTIYVWSQQAYIADQKRAVIERNNEQLVLEIAQTGSLTNSYQYAKKHGFIRVQSIMVVKRK